MTSAIEATGAPVAPGVPGPAIARLADMPRVDLMPPEIAERAALRRLQGGLAMAVVLSLLVVGALYLQAQSGVSSAQSRLAAAQAQQAKVQTKVNRLAPVAAVYTEVAAAKSEVAEALGGEIRWSGKLNDLSLAMPANVWLTNMSVATGSGSAGGILPSGLATITFQGVAEADATDPNGARDNVAQWLDTLAKEKGYSNPYVTVTQEAFIGLREVVNFTSTVTVNTAALSHRYTQQSGS